LQAEKGGAGRCSGMRLKGDQEICPLMEIRLAAAVSNLRPSLGNGELRALN
jgi:hypothetical protein